MLLVKANLTKINPKNVENQIDINLLNKTTLVAIDKLTPRSPKNPIIPNSVTPRPPGSIEMIPNRNAVKPIKVASNRLKVKENDKKHKYNTIASINQHKILKGHNIFNDFLDVKSWIDSYDSSIPPQNFEKIGIFFSKFSDLQNKVLFLIAI